MGFGSALSYGAVGASDSLEKILARRMKERQQVLDERRQAQMEQQQELNDRFRQREFDQRQAALNEQQLFNRQSRNTTTARDLAGTLSMHDMVPPEQADVLRGGGFSHLLESEQTLPSTQFSPGAGGTLRTMASPSQATGRERYLGTAPQRQAEQTNLARTAQQEKENAFREREIAVRENPSPSKPPAPDTGWTLQPVTDPKTNQTRLFRVNSRTGEQAEVTFPEGLHRQTRLTAAQQEDLATMKTVEDMAKQVSELGDRIGWKGVGGLWTGTLSQGAANVGFGSAEEEMLRNKIGNIQGTIARLRGGTSFTPNEQRLLDTYTPTINDGDARIKAKLQSLMEFIADRRKNTLLYAGADMTGSPQSNGSTGGVENNGAVIEEWERGPNGKPRRKVTNATPR